MSSYKKIKEVKCIYCSSSIPINLPSCLICKLYYPKTNVRINNINLKDIYIINLEKDSRRLSRFRQFLKYYNISLQKRNWNRFNAIDGYDLKLIHDTCKLMTDKNIIPIWKKHKGSIGCYLSHLKLWIKLKEEKQNYSLIMEDDAYFIKNGLNNLEIVLNQSLKYNWDILYIGNNIISGKKIHPLFVRPDYINRRGYNSGFFGYIINHKSIDKLLQIFSRFDSPFIDVQARMSFRDFNALFVKGNLIKHYDSKSSRKARDNIK